MDSSIWHVSKYVSHREQCQSHVNAAVTAVFLCDMGDSVR